MGGEFCFPTAYGSTEIVVFIVFLAVLGQQSFSKSENLSLNQMVMVSRTEQE